MMLMRKNYPAIVGKTSATSVKDGVGSDSSDSDGDY